MVSEVGWERDVKLSVWFFFFVVVVVGCSPKVKKLIEERKIKWLVAHEEIQAAETIAALCPCSPAGYDGHRLEAEPSKLDSE